MIDFEFEDEDVIEPDTFHHDTRLFRFRFGETPGRSDHLIDLCMTSESDSLAKRRSC